MLPAQLDIEVVVEAHSHFWVLDLGKALPSIAERKLVLVEEAPKAHIPAKRKKPS